MADGLSYISYLTRRGAVPPLSMLSKIYLLDDDAPLELVDMHANQESGGVTSLMSGVVDGPS